uniref:Uncharacterized protein n=1 Tax=Melopsittacus undulatus TaxID=13146 RepID=A0A8C6JF88_MELUD
MRPLGALFLAALLTGATAPCGSNSHPLHGIISSILCPLLLCLPRGDLEVIYPELGDVSCSYIPKCHQYRERISREWGSPRVRYPQADKKYVLMLVDPDVPSRANPRSRYWRHWLVTDIPVTLIFAPPDYVRPTPPPRSGYHRYQLLLHEQPAHEAITLSPEERSWAMESFVKQFRLGTPVASTQFLTKNHQD